MIRMVGYNHTAETGKKEIGTINLHGDITPVYSLRSLFGLNERKPLLSDNLIIVQKGQKTVALWVEESYIIQQGEIEAEERFHSEVLQTMIPGLRIIRSDLIILSDVTEFLNSGIYSLTKISDILGNIPTVHEEIIRSEDMRDYQEIEIELKKRAYDLSLPEGEVEKTPLIEVIRFNLMYQEYAIELKYIREVIQTSEITPVPGTPDFIAGICSVRGEIISLVDLRVLLSLPEKGLTDLNRVIVLSDNVNTFGILADQITGMGTIISDDIHRCKEECNRIWQDYCAGFIDSLIVLDAGSLLTDPRMVIDDNEAI